MRLHVNGRPHQLPDDAVLSTVVAAVAPEPRGVAVALNGGVVRSADWSTTPLRDGDLVEVVSAHQGG